MEKYPKIQTMFKRDPANNYKTLLVGQFARPEFEYLQYNTWEWSEKIDGTNLRVMWDGHQVRFGGRTDRAQLYMPLVEVLQETFTNEKMAAFLDSEGDYCLYGEGFGARIQKGGGNYIPDAVDFILFDVLASSGGHGSIWLNRDSVNDIANKFSIQSVPIMGSGSLWDALALVRSGDLISSVAATPDVQAEGLVMRPRVELTDRLGRRIITKLKYKDFPDGQSDSNNPSERTT